MAADPESYRKPLAEDERMPPARSPETNDRTRIAEELREQASLLQATLESTADGLLVVDDRGRISLHNRRFSQMWGIPEEVLATGDDSQALRVAIEQLEDPEGFLAKVRKLYGDPEAESFDILRLKDGRVFERYSMPQKIGERCVGRVWSFRDVSERHRLEEQMLQAQKLEAMGQLAGGIAHDFNNLLTVIKGYCQLCRLKAGPDSSLEEDLAQIAGAAQSAADLTSRLLAYSRHQVLEPQVLDLNLALERLEEMLGRLIGERIVLELDLTARPATVLADEGRVQQVVMNLVLNARDAMPEGGEITLATRDLEIDDRTAVAFGIDKPENGRMVLLSVRDTGPGIDPAVEPRIFEPFFTTKERGSGTGLGLATVYGIVKQSGGCVWVESPSGGTKGGAEFKIALPLADRPAAVPTAEPPRQEEAAERLRVLVVEDNPEVRRVLERVLAAEHEVISAETPRQARERVEDGLAVDLLVTDVILPEMDGFELARRLGETLPDLEVLYVSGYSPDSYAGRIPLRQGVNFLLKPFGPDQLLDAVRRLTARSPAAQ